MVGLAMFYNSAELADLRRARKDMPTLSQRALARHIYTNSSTYPAVSKRTQQSIYGSLRRLEKFVATTKTKGIQAAQARAADLATV